jgi:hypothetical protein
MNLTELSIMFYKKLKKSRLKSRKELLAINPTMTLFTIFQSTPL